MNILWVDDEIELLKPHVMFLKKKGYEVTEVTNGYDACAFVKNGDFDCVILDEIMVGMSGLDTLVKIKDISPDIKAIMLTKSEEEEIFLEAVGNKIDDYLTKPINPIQLYLSIKKVTEKQEIIKDGIKKKYSQKYRDILEKIDTADNWNIWVEIYKSLLLVTEEADTTDDDELEKTNEELFSNANRAFGQFFTNNYPDWITGSDIPLMSPDVISQFVKPELEENKTIFLIMDSLRADQLEVIRKQLSNYHNSTKYHCSIIPSVTKYARNSIFSGMFPDEFFMKYPELSENFDNRDLYPNRLEETMLSDHLNKIGLSNLNKEYIKIFSYGEINRLEQKLDTFLTTDLIAIVFDYMDFLLHDKNKPAIIKEMLSSEKAFRKTTASWFETSKLKNILINLLEKGFTLIITSDHGAKKVEKFTVVKGDGEISGGLRYKIGSNLSSSNKKQTAYFQKPQDIKMPEILHKRNMVISKENNCFIFENNHDEFFTKIKNTFQHGGISLEENIIPVMTFKKRN